MGDELRPCPFCGSFNACVTDHDGNTRMMAGHCRTCGASGPPELSWGDAAFRWNQRTAPTHDAHGIPLDANLYLEAPPDEWPEER